MELVEAIRLSEAWRILACREEGCDPGDSQGKWVGAWEENQERVGVLKAQVEAHLKNKGVVIRRSAAEKPRSGAIRGMVFGEWGGGGVKSDTWLMR